MLNSEHMIIVIKFFSFPEKNDKIEIEVILLVISVLVELSHQNVDKTFDYSVPKELQSKIQVGLRVTVPFGYQTLEGFVLEIKRNSLMADLKDILAIQDEEIVLNHELLELGKYMKSITLATLISCYQVMLPRALKAQNGTVIPIKYESIITMGNTVFDSEKLNDTQKKIIDLVQENNNVLKRKLTSISTSSVNTLIKKGILQEKKVEQYRLEEENVNYPKYSLTLEQQKIVDEVLSLNDCYTPFLLHGVTGSGKTEVYMEIIEHQLSQGKTGIVLVPEISLTPQIVNRFRSRFGSVVAILHSRLSEGEKYDEWRKIVRKEVSIVIGARSAIFAPLQNIGSIIVDEEPTTSYHQENNPRYSVIDIAFYRGIYHQCPVILGSATPSLESYARAKKGVYHLLELPHRVLDRPLPEVKVIDLNENKNRRSMYFSNDLVEAIQDRLAKKEQVLLLLNRRGYSSFITCSNCGYVSKCPNCDITLTYHKTSDNLRCHYCGYATRREDVCPNCHEKGMKSLGYGTERLEEDLEKLFPEARMIRMDFDTTTKKGAHEKIITDFGQGKYDVLLGTQMIAKGLDFPKVTLVGVINADMSLNIPDFRSSEYTFQLLDQVAGRSGRGERKGEVLIQTFNPDHYAIQFAKTHDYIGFYQKEMQIRHQLGYPPYYYLTSIKISSCDYPLLKTEANVIAHFLKRELSHTILLGPTPCFVFCVNKRYQLQIILKYKKEEKLYATLQSLLDHYKGNSRIRIDLDFNPNRFS